MGKSKDHKNNWLGLYAPRFWLSWLVVGLSWLLAKLPASGQDILAKSLTTLALKIGKSRIKTIRQNIELCFPELSPPEYQELVKKNLYSTILTLFDLLDIVWNSRESILSRGRIIGEKHLQEALAADKPLLIISGHTTSFISALVMLSAITPYAALYRRMDNPVLQAQLYERAMKKFPIEAIHRKEVTYMLQKLASKSVIVVLPDQDFGRKRSVFIPFFGIDTATITAIPQYARSGDANVLFLFNHREPNRRHVIEIEPMLENYPSGDDIADTILWSDWLEKKIREHPENYFWLHRRFKTRPEGEPKLY